MKKTWVLIVGIVLVIVAAITYVAVSGGRVSSPVGNTSVPAADKKPTSETAPPAQPGSYIAYNADAFAKAVGRRVIFFHAPWCPQCRELEKTIQEGVIPAGVTIFKADFDTSTDLRTTYGVTMQTTMVEVDQQARVVKKFVAYYSPTLAAVIKELEL